MQLTHTEEQIHGFCTSMGYDRTPMGRLKKLMGEFVELTEATATYEVAFQMEQPVEASMHAVAMEAADIAIILADWMALHGFSLEQMMVRKMLFNIDRARKEAGEKGLNLMIQDWDGGEEDITEAPPNVLEIDSDGTPILRKPEHEGAWLWRFDFMDPWESVNLMTKHERLFSPSREKWADQMGGEWKEPTPPPAPLTEPNRAVREATDYEKGREAYKVGEPFPGRDIVDETAWNRGWSDQSNEDLGISAYDQGRAAWKLGIIRDQCPAELFQTGEADRWGAGWDAADLENLNAPVPPDHAPYKSAYDRGRADRQMGKPQFVPDEYLFEPEQEHWEKGWDDMDREAKADKMD